MNLVVCARCQRDITRPFQLDTTLRSEASLRRVPAQRNNDPSAVPAGKAATVEHTFWTGGYFGDGEEVTAPRLWLNLADVLDHVELDHEVGTGCCGPNGRINRRCSCGQLVGREYSDCMEPHRFSPEPDATNCIEFIADEAERERDRVKRTFDANRRLKSVKSLHNKKPKP